MPLRESFKFNDFPIHKDRFFDLVENLYKYDGNFKKLFDFDPTMYDKIYVTMTQDELERLCKRINSPEAIEGFKTALAMFLTNKTVILHVPSIAKDISGLPEHLSDSNRRATFTKYFFICLFHELSHSVDFTKANIINSVNKLLGDTIKFDSAAIFCFEAAAEKSQYFYMGLLEDYLKSQNKSWLGLAEELFDWDKLQKHITQ